jgi:hypothetical protein
MRSWHSAAAMSAQFDDPNLVSCEGLVPVMRLAQNCGLDELVGEQVTVAGPLGANTPFKIGCVVAGMIAGADSIDDLDLLRQTGLGELFDGVRAPSTLGSFLRAFSWGNVHQLEAVNRRLLAELAARTPILPDADALTWLDIDSCQRRVYGHAKQGAGFGHAKVGGYSVRLRGLHPLIAAISTPTSASVVAGTRLRGATAASARGAASFASESITTARGAGASITPPPSPRSAAAEPAQPPRRSAARICRPLQLSPPAHRSLRQQLPTGRTPPPQRPSGRYDETDSAVSDTSTFSSYTSTSRSHEMTEFSGTYKVGFRVGERNVAVPGHEPQRTITVIEFAARMERSWHGSRSHGVPIRPARRAGATGQRARRGGCQHRRHVCRDQRRLRG